MTSLEICSAGIKARRMAGLRLRSLYQPLGPSSMVLARKQISRFARNDNDWGSLNLTHSELRLIGAESNFKS